MGVTELALSTTSENDPGKQPGSKTAERHIQRKGANMPEETPYQWIKFYVDGGTFPGRGIYWSMLCAADKSPFPVRCKSTAYKTNNDAEWLAVREALQHAAAHYRDVPIIIYSDSKLVVNQFNGVWRTKIARHHRFRSECRALADQLKFVVLQWVPRAVSVEKLGH